MPLSDRERLAGERNHARIVDLWLALQPLKSTVSFMQSGAHPDDETTAMLAALAYRDGLGLSYACANRGEGGQNDIGTELTAELGTTRTAEMERAADVLGLHLYWLSTSPDDSIFDFGFSKSGSETMGKWGRERTLRRFVEIVRQERPDILCPTFLDVPGQHGHHRAMTEAAHLVMAAAADPGFAEVELAPWEIKKLYLPAWSGGGGSYDDEVPPPPATLTITGTGVDPVTGWSWARLAQQSRAFHQTQGMGRWVPAGEERDWPLHLATSRVAGPDTALPDGLPATLDDLADIVGAQGAPLRAAGAAMRDALASFPDFDATLEAVSEALRRLRSMHDVLSGQANDGEVLHRLQRKERQLARVIRLAAGVQVHGHLDREWLRPGETAAVSLERRSGAADNVELSVDLPEGWREDGGRIGPDENSPPSDPYPAVYLPSDPPGPALRVAVTARGMTSVTHAPLEVPPVVLPARTADVFPDRAVINTAAASRVLDISVRDVVPAGSVANIELPEGWNREATGSNVRIEAPADIAEGLYTLPLTVAGAEVHTVRRIAYRHIAPRALAAPAALAVRVVRADLPDVRVGYVGGGNDRVGAWLTALGVYVTDLSDADLSDRGRLADFDTVVVGIFAMRFREALRPAMTHLHAWVEAGGNLLTLYHRPWDNWDPDAVPPRRLEIGQPSLRWRVTDEAAAVHHLAPDHPLLTTPNVIGPEDWAGWHKERGLYFAKSWDDAYTPLLEMADPDEAPHRGALLSAEIGAGRHTHCALILHHQMEKLTPGAFRLFANLIG